MASDCEPVANSGARLQRSMSPRPINPGMGAADQVFANQELKGMILHQVFAETFAPAGDMFKNSRELDGEPSASGAVNEVFGTNELVELILEELPLKDVARAQTVCKIWHELTMRSKRIGYGEVWFKEAESVLYYGEHEDLRDLDDWEISQRKWKTHISFADDNSEGVECPPPVGCADTSHTGNLNVHFWDPEQYGMKTKPRSTFHVSHKGDELWRRFRITDLPGVYLSCGWSDRNGRCWMTSQSTLGDMYDWLHEEFKIRLGQATWLGGNRLAQDFDSVVVWRIAFEDFKRVDPITGRAITQEELDREDWSDYD